MKIHMLKTVKGSEDGLHIALYKAGEEYDISPTLAKTFLDNKFGVEVPPAAPVTPPESKNSEDPKKGKKGKKGLEAAPENKEQSQDAEGVEDKGEKE